MEERTRRVGRNEALFRNVNEELEALERPLAGIADNMLHIVCECGDLLCNERVSVDVGAYEKVRADPTLFFVLAGHELPDVEHVVDDGDGYRVVRKDPGPGEQVARETDTRS